jgi:hypothetical protein
MVMAIFKIFILKFIKVLYVNVSDFFETIYIYVF